ncbi:hypothetical protein Tco_0695188 [Tanacetum coccineum]
MVKSTLSYSGLIEGFWGEAMLTNCYLLNRVPNKRKKLPLMNSGLKGNKPELSQSLWLKALLFYVIELNTFVSINSIIESTDLIFDEIRSSSIPRPSHMILNTSGTHDDDISVSEVPEEVLDVAFWKEAINDEMDSIMGNGTYI